MSLLEKVGKKNIDNKKKTTGRIAVYDTVSAPPRLIEVESENWTDLIEKITTTTYRECQQKGAVLPYVVIREVVENLIHASFSEIIVSIFDNWQTIRVSDQGPGIENKVLAFEPGYTTATANMKEHIRGVGSGLPVIKEIMTFSGGKVEIDDNLKTGTVLTLKMSAPKEEPRKENKVFLSKRQFAILSLVTELGLAGPSDINKELGLSISTVHRELIYLEEAGLIALKNLGKRSTTLDGIDYLNDTIHNTDGF